MKWSMRLGRIRGIEVRLHLLTPIVLAGFALLMSMNRARDAIVLAEIPANLAFIVLLFGCVLLHELGHSVMAQAHGIRVRDIVLLFFGGVARLEQVPEEPWTELKIAVAGPAVNLVIFIILTPVVLGLGAVEVLTGGGGGSALLGLVAHLWIANFVLMAFNLLPIFPLDGGRVLRALLAFRMSFLRATEVASTVGKIGAVALIVAGLILGPNALGLVVIGLFVFIFGGNEARMVRLRHMQARPIIRDGVEILLPGAPDPAPRMPPVRPLFFDFGIYNREEILREFDRLLRRMEKG